MDFFNSIYLILYLYILNIDLNEELTKLIVNYHRFNYQKMNFELLTHSALFINNVLPGVLLTRIFIIYTKRYFLFGIIYICTQCTNNYDGLF